MVFKRRKFSSTEEILELMKSDTEIMSSTAVIYFHRSDRVSGKIYLRKGAEQGLVYAAHVSNMPFHIGKRLKPHLKDDQYEEILRQVGGDDTDPNIARIAVSKQFVSEKTVDAYIREYLFAAASEIFSWQEVIAKWESGTETRDFASKQYIRLDLLQKKAAIRDTQYQTALQDVRLDEEKIDRLKVLRNGDLESFAAIENKNLQIILKYADGKHTVEELRDETGLLKVPAFMGIHALWNTGHIKLIAGDIPVYPPNVNVEEEEEEPEEEVQEVIELQEEPEENPEVPEVQEEDEPEEEPEVITEEPEVHEANDALEDIKGPSPIEDTDFDVVEVATPQEEEMLSPSEEWIVGEVVNTEEEEEPAVSFTLPNLEEEEPEEDSEELSFDVPEAETKPLEIKEEPMETPVNNTVSNENPGMNLLGRLNERIANLENASARVKMNISEIDKASSHIDTEIESLQAQIDKLHLSKEQSEEKRKALIEEEKAVMEKLNTIIQTIDELTAS